MSSKSNESIDDQVERSRQRLSHCPWWSTDHLDAVDGLAHDLLNRFEQLGGMEYLEEAVAYSREGIEIGRAHV